MSKVKDQQAMLEKLGIAELNPMQSAAHQAIAEQPELILIAPTGTGKTLAFLLPVIARLDPGLEAVQALILVPSRELAIQIEQIARDMGSGFKVNAVYGGRAGYKDKQDLKHPPAILVGTPGRIADHIEREHVGMEQVKALVLDEFDKSLETGFEKQMRGIIACMPAVERKILTSATQNVNIPDFVGLKAPVRLQFGAEEASQLALKAIAADEVDEYGALALLLAELGEGRGIVFCSLKETLNEVSVFLSRKKIAHASFYGGMGQLEREHALIQFRNGTHRILLSTDLAARGLDIPELDYIIHFEFPFDEASFVHRNGRTARMHSEGAAYLIKPRGRQLPHYARGAEMVKLSGSGKPALSHWATLHMLGGRRDKISKGDIAGLFLKEGGLEPGQLGVIELKQDAAYIAVDRGQADRLAKALDNKKLKKKKIRLRLMD
ncbi:DEAD/DEAH box helicase [Phaeodactylibacter luteus]|uniref:DEAD/DEAH box helicase n=1 Tax=Phaeodactylibacter luteus TaxID=1564516 RepID=A0A5C6RHE8_9BACT|nr:DEAD/DEAH box helicase [Phaeodactylibacter luteus]TXB61816.1 DEAD/DEAH box helicase [Phaeodactylibacter luteus]